MRLLQKTNRYYFLFTAILLILVGTLLYYILTNITKNEITEKLVHNKTRIAEQIKNNNDVIELPPVIEISALELFQVNRLIVNDTVMFDPVENDVEPFRQLDAIENIHGKTYRIILRQIILEPHDYYNSIAFTIITAILLLLISLYLLNRLILRNIWRPFYYNLESIKNFALQKNKSIKLLSSNITEFSELNVSIEKLTEKANADYQSQKEFIENASHEMQTPLSVIQAKLELFLQSENLNEEQAAQIKSAYTSVQRISKLNNALLLLTKIGNNHFVQKENISIAEALEKQLLHFDDFIVATKLEVDNIMGKDITVNASRPHIEILLSNLIDNAIKHNIYQGKIKIELQGRSLVISNTGKPLTVNPYQLFERFKKGDPSSASLGLGLSISKKICDINGWQMNYTTKNEMHTFLVHFS